MQQKGGFLQFFPYMVGLTNNQRNKKDIVPLNYHKLGVFVNFDCLLKLRHFFFHFVFVCLCHIRFGWYFLGQY